MRGRAGVIEYDFAAGVVRLTDQVWFSNGKDEFRGDVVIYNVRDERVQINPGGQSSEPRARHHPAAQSVQTGEGSDAGRPSATDGGEQEREQIAIESGA